jgi:hypothetical protein
MAATFPPVAKRVRQIPGYRGVQSPTNGFNLIGAWTIGLAIMRFFTLDWWCGFQEGNFAKGPLEDYRSFLATIRDRLPPGLLALQEKISLHDGDLRELELWTSRATIKMIIHGDDGSGGFQRFRLDYSGVSLFQSMADPEFGLPGPNGYGRWGYDEVDVLQNGEFEHRILFSSGIEIVIRFADFDLST